MQANDPRQIQDFAVVETLHRWSFVRLVENIAVFLTETLTKVAFPFQRSQMKTFILALTVASATAFAPAAPKPTSSTALFLEMGAYDGKLWDNEAKKTMYESWDPKSPRTVDNFNPFETWDGNSPVS